MPVYVGVVWSLSRAFKANFIGMKTSLASGCFRFLAVSGFGRRSLRFRVSAHDLVLNNKRPYVFRLPGVSLLWRPPFHSRLEERV